MSYSSSWKRNERGGIVRHNDLPVLEFVAVQRKDTGQWALPGVSLVDTTWRKFSNFWAAAL